MDAKTFFEKHGRDESRAVAVAAGTNYAYFYQFVTGARRPSLELAKKLVEASDGRLELLALLEAKRVA